MDGQHLRPKLVGEFGRYQSVAAQAIQLNDVLVDDRGVLFTVDRMIGGLYAYELKV